MYFSSKILKFYIRYTVFQLLFIFYINIAKHNQKNSNYDRYHTLFFNNKYYNEKQKLWHDVRCTT